MRVYFRSCNVSSLEYHRMYNVGRERLQWRRVVSCNVGGRVKISFLSRTTGDCLPCIFASLVLGGVRCRCFSRNRRAAATTISSSRPVVPVTRSVTDDDDDSSFIKYHTIFAATVIVTVTDGQTQCTKSTPGPLYAQLLHLQQHTATAVQTQ